MHIIRKHKGQILLLVSLMLLLGTILAGGLHSMWQSNITIFSLERDSLQAFYLAQAAIERAKIAVLYNFTIGTYNRPITGNLTEDPDGDGFFEDLDISTVPNCHYQYSFTVVNPGSAGAQSRNLIGTGRVLDAANSVVATRTITLTVDGIQDGTGNGIDDNIDLATNPVGTIVADTWEEQ